MLASRFATKPDRALFSRRHPVGFGLLLIAALSTGCSTGPRGEMTTAIRAPATTESRTPESLSTQLPTLPQREPADPNVSPETLRVPPGFAGLLKKDVPYIVTAPLRWDGADWGKLGLSVLAVGGVMLIDEHLRRSIDRDTNPTRRTVADAVKPFGEDYSWGVIGAFYLSGKLFQNEKAESVSQDALASSLIAAGVITPALKLAFGRRRPSQTPETVVMGVNGHSFPSGHTTQAFAVASVIASHYDSLWVDATAYGIAGLVGWSRMEHNAHFASDVLAGALIGIAVGKAVVAFNEGDRLRITPEVSLNPASPGLTLSIRTDLKDLAALFRSD